VTPSLTVIFVAVFAGSRASVESLMSGPREQTNICTPLYIKQSQEPSCWQSFIVELVIVIIVDLKHLLVEFSKTISVVRCVSRCIKRSITAGSA